MISVSTSDIISSIPIGALAGGMIAVFYSILRMLALVLIRVPKIVKDEAFVRHEELKEIYVRLKEDNKQLNPTLQVTLDVVIIAISAALFALVSYVSLDGNLRFEVLISFAASFFLFRFVWDKCFYRIYPVFLTALCIPAICFIRMMSQMLKVALFLRKVIVKVPVFRRFFAKTDKM